MPIYEYQCEACAHRLEALQKISAAPLLECPNCKAPRLRKMVSAAGFRLKGGGWYETDFKSGGKKNVSGDKDSAAPADSGSAAAAPAAPATATNSTSSSTSSSTSAPAADAS